MISKTARVLLSVGGQDAFEGDLPGSAALSPWLTSCLGSECSFSSREPSYVYMSVPVDLCVCVWQAVGEGGAGGGAACLAPTAGEEGARRGSHFVFILSLLRYH